jgi:hypothetical protein
MSRNNNIPGPARARKVEVMPTRKVIEVAPDKKIVPLPKEHLPELAIARLQDCGDGTYRPVLKIIDPELKIFDAVKVLGIPYRMLLRLCRAGFVEYSQPAPHSIKVNLVSWFEHVEKVKQDPEFWQREKNRQAYRNAL